MILQTGTDTIKGGGHVVRTTRYSRKREAILKAIRQTKCHPSADWVYQTLKPQHPDLSLGTVYRNLSFLQEMGEIRSVGVVQGQERYDGDTTSHPHFVCTECGCVIDLERFQFDAELEQTVSQQYGLPIQRHELIFYGTCQSCMHKNSEEDF